jgi:hypothetical protein
MVERTTDGLVEGRLKIAVVDPRLSQTAAKARKWVPIQPGIDAALPLGMIRWIIDNQRYDCQVPASREQSRGEGSRRNDLDERDLSRPHREGWTRRAPARLGSRPGGEEGIGKRGQEGHHLRDERRQDELCR